jgi:hypothetical protein
MGSLLRPRLLAAPVRFLPSAVNNLIRLHSPKFGPVLQESCRRKLLRALASNSDVV